MSFLYLRKDINRVFAVPLHEEGPASGHGIAVKTSSGVKWACANEKKCYNSGIMMRAGNQNLYINTNIHNEIADMLGTKTYCDRCGNIWRLRGQPTIDTDIKRIGTSSVKFENGSCIYMTDWNLTLPKESSFSIRFFFYLDSSTSNGFFAWKNTTRDNLMVFYNSSNSKLGFYVFGTQYVTSTTINLQTWYHFDATYINGLWRFYINGSQIYTLNTTGTFATTSISLGANSNGTTVWSSANCHINSLDFCVGYCGVEIPSSAFNNETNNTTSRIILAHFNQYYRDTTENVWTVTGYPSILPASMVDTGTTWNGKSGRCLYIPSPGENGTPVAYTTLYLSANTNYIFAAKVAGSDQGWWVGSRNGDGLFDSNTLWGSRSFPQYYDSASTRSGSPTIGCLF